jgi:hypothetical protein
MRNSRIALTPLSGMVAAKPFGNSHIELCHDYEVTVTKMTALFPRLK